MAARPDPSLIASARPHRSHVMTPVLVRPARDVDTVDLVNLARLDSARPLTGEVLLAVQGGEVAAAMSLDTGAVVADPLRPTAHLVELLRTAGRPVSRPRRSAPPPAPPPPRPGAPAAGRGRCARCGPCARPSRSPPRPFARAGPIS